MENINNHEKVDRSKHKIKKLPDLEGYNNSFYICKNMQWYYFVINWLPDPDKPLVFLPCGRAEKTRKKYGKKRISEGMTHNFLKALRTDVWFEKVILSEPLTIIPYALEMHPLRPDYNLPAKDLSIQSEKAFINQLALWLLKVKLEQPERKYVYYCGATHHYYILFWANLISGFPYKIIYEIPPCGIASYSVSAEKLSKIIYDLELRDQEPDLVKVDMDKFLKARGRYTNRKFWKEILISQKLKMYPKTEDDFSYNRIEITSINDFSRGMKSDYEQLLKSSQKSSFSA